VLDLSSQDIYPLMQSILVSLAQICPGIEAVKSKRRCTYLQHLHLAPNHGREKDVVLKPVCGSIFFYNIFGFILENHSDGYMKYTVSA
jgi:hypothetical protein